MNLVEFDILKSMEGGEQRSLTTGIAAFEHPERPTCRITVEWDKDRGAIKIYKHGFTDDAISITAVSTNVILIK